MKWHYETVPTKPQYSTYQRPVVCGNIKGVAPGGEPVLAIRMQGQIYRQAPAQLPEEVGHRLCFRFRKRSRTAVVFRARITGSSFAWLETVTPKQKSRF